MQVTSSYLETLEKTTTEPHSFTRTYHTLNLQKCKFLKKNLEFFGLVFTEKGISPDPKKVDAFVNAKHPTTVSEVRSLRYVSEVRGMANYSSKFIKNYATITEPLRQLTRKNTPSSL